MPLLIDSLQHLNALVWGAPMLVLILGTGIYLTVSLKFLTWRKIGEAEYLHGTKDGLWRIWDTQGDPQFEIQ